MTTDTPMRLLVINSNPDTCDMLREYFGYSGWRVSTLLSRELRAGTVSAQQVAAEHQPDVIVFDVALPYETNWQTLEDLEADPHITCPIVVTTTNEAVLRRLIHPPRPLLEIIGKPYDLEALRAAIVAARDRRDTQGSVPEAPERRRRERRLGDRRSPDQSRDTADDRYHRQRLSAPSDPT